MTALIEKDAIDELQSDWKKQRPDLNLKPMGVILRIQTLDKIFSDQAADRLQKFDLQWWQYDVLSTLRRQGEPFLMTATELADSTMLTSGAMTNRIDRLEQAKLVRRVNDKNDRRRVLVQLTKKGLRLIDKASEARFDVAMNALKNLSVRQQNTLSNLLRQVLTTQDY